MTEWLSDWVTEWLCDFVTELLSDWLTGWLTHRHTEKHSGKWSPTTILMIYVNTVSLVSIYLDIWYIWNLLLILDFIPNLLLPCSWCIWFPNVFPRSHRIISPKVAQSYVLSCLVRGSRGSMAPAHIEHEDELSPGNQHISVPSPISVLTLSCYKEIPQ